MATKEKLGRLPSLPGVYIFKGSKGETLYIGKAKSLRARVRSYFSKSAKNSDSRYAVRFLAERTKDIEYIVTTNEKEALILEDTLLKKHRPRYNIRLKDDKTYLSIKLTVNEEFPRLLTTRRVKKDGSRYFGPYASAGKARESIKLLRRIFPLCVCSPATFKNMIRPCLDHQLGICAAPAASLITKEAYAEIVKGAIMLLEGKNRQVIKNLKTQMREASKTLDFEDAATYRDRLEALTATLEEQKVVSSRGADQDIVALAREEKRLALQVLQIRDGRLVASKGYTFTDTLLPIEEILSSFLTQFYKNDALIPIEIILRAKPPDSDFIEKWLTEKKGRKVRLTKPARGLKRKLLEMAEVNAAQELKKKRQEGSLVSDPTLSLQKRLRLRKKPKRIEAFDISNIGSKHAVGALVSFISGKPDKANYRRFKIKTIDTQNDYAMIREVLLRRYSVSKDKRPMPDLILIDGGKGQLSMALQVLEELGLTKIQTAAISKGKPSELEKHKARILAARKKGKPEKAKPRERIYLPNVKDPIFLKEGLPPDLYLRRIRDEVHRFAITYHRKLRSKEIGSALGKIPGIGKKKEIDLLKHFGDIKNIKKASNKELTLVPGITEKLAKTIKENLD